jgi:ankyrin repeat protein
MTADVSSLGVIYAAVDGEVTLLMAACDMSKHGIVRRLLQCVTPHTVNMVSSNVHDTALHFTIASETEAHNPMLVASGKGENDTVEDLLYESNVDIQVAGGSTALHWVCMYGHEDIVRLLLCVFARTDITNDDRWTPAMVAEAADHTQVLHCLQLTLAKPPDIVVPMHDNNNSVSLSVVSVDNVSKLNNNNNNSSKRFRNRPLSNNKLAKTKVV